MSSLQDNIRKILIDHWDPHNVAQRPEAHGTYDVFIPRLIELIQSGAGEEAIVDYLKEREAETMCFPGLGRERLRIAAKKLAGLRESGQF
jgi:hypothetical protein